MQSISGTHLYESATAPRRRPCLRFLVDWQRQGWANQNQWSDESSRVLSFSVQMAATDLRQGVSLLGNAVAGSARVELANVDDRFTPDYTQGPLYPYISNGGMVGIPCLLQAGFFYGNTPELLTQFAGYIDSPAVGFSRGAVQLSLVDRSWDLSQNKVRTAVFSGSVNEYIASLLNLLPEGKRPQTDVDQGLFPLLFAWADEETIWEELSRVATAQGGYIWFNKEGKLIFRDVSFLARILSSSQVVPQELCITKVLDASVQWNDRDIYNHVTVRWSGGRLARLVEVWRYNGVLGPLQPQEVRPVEASPGMLVYSYLAPEWDTDYQVFSSSWEEVPKGDVQVRLVETYGQFALLEVKNLGTKPIYLTSLRLRGWPVDFQDMETLEVEDGASIQKYGKRSLAVDLVYIQGWGHARSIAEFLLDRYRVPRASYQVQIPALPWLEVGDLVEVQAPRKGRTVLAEGRYLVLGLRQEFSPSSGYCQTLNLLHVEEILPYSDWFLVGETALGEGRWYY